jgi:hypothetical protein
MDNWTAINIKFKQILKEKRYTPGAWYRAVTIDGDIFDGVLTFVSNTTVELQIGNSFKAFNRSTTKLVKHSSLERE